MTRILITGSRTWDDEKAIENAIRLVCFGLDPHSIVIVHGDNPKGADAIADKLAVAWHLQVERHPADWDRHGRAAGPLRNNEMAALGADICLAFPTVESRGTIHMMKAAEEASIYTVNLGKAGRKMALIARLFINDEPIAIVSAQRMETGPNGINTYKAEQWAIDGDAPQWTLPRWNAEEKIAPFTHEAADGAIVCMGKAIAALQAVE